MQEETSNKKVKPSFKYDGVLTIVTGRSRRELEWKNRETLWSELVRKLSVTTRTHETYGEYKKLPKAERDDIKDVGGFVGGTLKGGRRKADCVVWRQIITLDADHVKGDLWAGVEVMFGRGCCMYSTHSHSPSFPRLRLVIPLKRPVSPDEYQAVSRRIAGDLGIDFFDDSTYQPHRLMYWPSTSKDGEFIFKYLDEEWADPDEILARYPDWRDPSYWPESSRTKAERKKLADKQGDPREKPGIVGAFCRTYTIAQVIEKFLSDVYAPGDDPSRYTYIPGSTAGGLVLYDRDNFAYSYHATDPICGKLCNAFDLVRLHKFGELDDEAKDGTPVNKLPSYMAMQRLATEDLEVKKQVAAERMESASDDFKGEEDWQAGLEIDNRGELKNTLTNMSLIIKHDPALAGIYYNQLRDGVDADGELPWKRLKAGWNKTDDANLAGYIDARYKLYSPGKLRDAALKVAVERARHPIREYLNSLPKWDGVERLDRILIDYLGAEDSEYVRAVTRKTLVAAVARVMEPGIKFDYMLVLNGPQGIGKSTLFNRLGGEWFSDSLSIADMRDKTAAEKLQGYWIVEIGELAGIKKIDEETLKSFLSRQDDKYRAAYGYAVEDHPRQCIIVGSTNKTTGFLRDLTGNRRFWPVRVPGSQNLKPWDLKDVDQIWAEAIVRYRAGEKLFLEGALEETAQKVQLEALESDDREGLVREYLDRLLPTNWDEMELSDRRGFIRGDGFSDSIKGEVKRQMVCTLEIWCELFCKEPSAMRKIDSYELNAIMRKIEGWEQSDKTVRLPIYGKQRVYIRLEQE
ncbi:Virulence-associated E family protein [Tepidanaerobacter acetatoxydans Re1]|uniref:Virulence-associated E family protein n=1 Tax=Tepidanaerobacter acetatoxydans (strain DSM 21804 / JCM 16047 / Re1) TaxID=1209989 RepID=F4LTU3_TEPAE|nr:virulence-associated E family protein [Tepidanaerobacter acetatoxydans]AEE92540.1 virulence-associated E family protein [Tepidanaerobacter acetatoxydans Re1]CCP27490.1 Virulence-associated E family protein [Tepidanaerobacter acetatoxydans Re1]